MTRVSFCAILAISIFPCAAVNAKELALPKVSVGAHLQTTVAVALSEPAPLEGLPVTITSSDPDRVRLSADANQEGAASITMTARGNFRVTPDFYVQGLAERGSVTLTASAAGFAKTSNSVTLLPSAILIGGLNGAKGSFQSTAGSRPFKLSVFSAAIDPEGNFTPQALLPGVSAKVAVTVADSAIGSLAASNLTIAGGTGNAVTLFQPLSAGQTNLAVSAPPGFSAATKFSTLTAVVNMPGVGITSDVMIGKDLQIGGGVSLGSRAPKGGVDVTLTSDFPDKLILSPSNTTKGSGKIVIHIPENEVTATYFLQALDGSGNVTYSASAAGYRPRTATVTLTPSGVVMVGPLTLPEGQLLRSSKQGGARQQGFFTKLSSAPTLLLIHTVQLDPESLRAADITIQALRAGMDLKVDLSTTNPAAGSMDSQVTIHGGSDRAETKFEPKAEGYVELTVVTPPSFTHPANDALLKVTVSK